MFPTGIDWESLDDKPVHALVGHVSYASHGTDETRRLIRQAEEESLNCCERCGATEGVATEGPGWIRTLCRSCREETRANTG